MAKPNLPALEMAKNAATVQERLRLLLANDPAKDKAARFLWPFLSDAVELCGRADRRGGGRCAVDRPGDEGGLQLGTRAV